MKSLPIIAIVGRTNVGKSSIFNAILQRREAIVAREEGTTRDSIMGRATHEGQDFWLVDTAGMKDPDDDFEATIQEQISQALDSADVIWVVIESNTVITDEDRQVAKLALKSRKPVFLVVNKIDKIKNFDVTDFQKLGIKQIIGTSTTQYKGFDELLDLVVDQIPKAKAKYNPNLIKLAVVGRPNVGKSQLFNTLLKKQQAVVSERAGTTRDVNKTSVNYKGGEIELMDTAGIRRNGKIGHGIEHFSVIRTLAAIEESDICLLLIDVNELSVALDQKIAGMVKESNKGLVLVVSKWDSVEEKDFLHDKLIPRIKHDYEFVPWAPVVFTSSVTGQNVNKLFEIAVEIKKQRDKKLKTTELNRWLKTVTGAHPPAGLKNRSPKLNYIIQENDNPSPTFKVFGAHTKYLHWSYKRYMERQLRETFGFEGTSIKFWFFEKHVDRLKEKVVSKNLK